ncbi:MAG: DUF1330 domain-containing protein [Burkholderiales bacterium]|nr:DUF1330 domain-containing protein [Burkholderiales bacterium]
MAKGYAVFTETIGDQARYEGYVSRAVATITNAGGKIIVVDDNVSVLEGQWHGTRTVVLEFDSVSAAQAWYNSNDYQAIIKERHASAEANAVLLKGVGE